MIDNDEANYRTGLFVGRVMGALMHGCKEMAGTWPNDAPKEAKEEIQSIANFQGLVVTFDANGFSVSERKKPKLEMVN